jgi:hypothetical protein
MPASLAVTVMPPLGAPGVPAYIGGNPVSGQVFSGDIAEIIFVAKSLDAMESTMMYAYLQSKYGVP